MSRLGHQGWHLGLSLRRSQNEGGPDIAASQRGDSVGRANPGGLGAAGREEISGGEVGAGGGLTSAPGVPADLRAAGEAVPEPGSGHYTFSAVDKGKSHVTVESVIPGACPVDIPECSTRPRAACATGDTEGDLPFDFMLCDSRKRPRPSLCPEARPINLNIGPVLGLEAGRPALRSFHTPTGELSGLAGTAAENSRFVNHEKSFDSFIQCRGTSVPCSQGETTPPAQQSPLGPRCVVLSGAQAPLRQNGTSQE